MGYQCSFPVTAGHSNKWTVPLGVLQVQFPRHACTDDELAVLAYIKLSSSRTASGY
jgi:hypothetical protein